MARSKEHPYSYHRSEDHQELSISRSINRKKAAKVQSTTSDESSDIQQAQANTLDVNDQKAVEKLRKYSQNGKTQQYDIMSSVDRKLHNPSNLEKKKKRRKAEHHKSSSYKPSESLNLKSNSLVVLTGCDEIALDKAFGSTTKTHDDNPFPLVTRSDAIDRTKLLSKNPGMSRLVQKPTSKVVNSNIEPINEFKIQFTRASINSHDSEPAIPSLYCSEGTLPAKTPLNISNRRKSKRSQRHSKEYVKSGKSRNVCIAKELAQKMLKLLTTLNEYFFLLKETWISQDAGRKSYRSSFEAINSVTRTNLLSTLARSLENVSDTKSAELLSLLKHQDTERQVLLPSSLHYSSNDENYLLAAKLPSNCRKGTNENSSISSNILDFITRFINDDDRKYFNLLWSCLEQQAIGRSVIEQLYGCLRERKEQKDYLIRLASSMLCIEDQASCNRHNNMCLDSSAIPIISHCDGTKNVADLSSCSKLKMLPSSQSLPSKLTVESPSMKPPSSSAASVPHDLKNFNQILTQLENKVKIKDKIVLRDLKRLNNKQSQLSDQNCFEENSVTNKKSISSVDYLGKLEQPKCMTFDEIRKHNERKFLLTQKEHSSMLQQHVTNNELAPHSKSVCEVLQEDETPEMREQINNTSLAREQQFSPTEKQTQKATGICNIHTHSFLIETFSEMFNGTPVSVGRREVHALMIYENPEVVLMNNFLTPDECEDIIKEANSNGWEKSRTSKGLVSAPQESYTAGEGLTRTSSSSRLNRGSSKVVDRVQKRVAAASQSAVECIESLVVVRYFPGQFFKAHYDGFFRPKTVLIYLNEVSDGGETEFVELGFKVKPQLGTALMWNNTADDGTPDYKTLHAGLPISSGVKYVVNCFINKDNQSIVADQATALVEDTKNSKERSLLATPGYSNSTASPFYHNWEKQQTAPSASFANIEQNLMRDDDAVPNRLLALNGSRSPPLKPQEAYLHKYSPTADSRPQLNAFLKSSCGETNFKKSCSTKCTQPEKDFAQFAKLMEYHSWLKQQQKTKNLTTRKRSLNANEYSSVHSKLRDIGSD